MHATANPPIEHPYRVLVVLPNASTGGGVRVVGELVREWAAMGVDVRTLSLSTSSAAARVILRHAPHECLGGHNSVLRLLRLQRHLRRTAQHYDVIFAIGDYPAMISHIARMVLRKSRRPTVVNGVHQPRPFVTSIANSRRSRPVRWLGRRTVLTTIRRVDGYIFLSTAQMEMYRGLGVSAKVAQTVIPNPVRLGVADQEHFERRDARLRQGERVRLMTIGALNDQKNHLLMLRALAQLDRLFILSVVGGGEREPDLRSHVNTLDLHDRVKFLGPREDIDVLLDANDIFVLSSDYEASPLVVLEAMVRGLPVVSTDCAPSSREFSDNFASFRVVPIKDVARLASEVQALAANPPSTAELLLAATEVLKRHSVKHAARSHLRFFVDHERPSRSCRPNA